VGAYSCGALLCEATLRENPRAEGFFRRYLMSPDEFVVARAQQRLWAGEVEGPDGAVELFGEALRRDMASPYRWCDLGEALLEAGQTEQARYCFQRGVELGPHSPQTLLRAANFHFRIGEEQKALPYTSRVLGMTADYDAAVFGSYSRMGVSIEEVLARGIPADRRAAQSFFRYVLGQGGLREARAAWEWMGAHSFADDRLADQYAAVLVRLGEYQAAVGMWGAQVGPHKEGYPVSNSVYNGSFEREPAGTTFDWRIAPSQSVHAERDAAVASSGRWSLRIRFEGKENVAYSHVSQRVVVKPGAYRFEAELRASEITTDQGVGFRIVDREDARRLDVRTERLRGTTDWRRVELRFRAPERTKLVEIQVVREPSLKFDNKISGTVWIDEVVLAASR
jgi:hypothetical protein